MRNLPPSGSPQAKDSQPSATSGCDRQMLRAQSQQGDRLVGRDEWVRDDTPVRQGQAGNCLAIDQGDQDLPRQLGRTVQRSEPVDHLGIVGVGEPQLDPGRGIPAEHVMGNGHGFILPLNGHQHK
jgi:hypothetical protein